MRCHPKGVSARLFPMVTAPLGSPRTVTFISPYDPWKSYITRVHLKLLHAPRALASLTGPHWAVRSHDTHSPRSRSCDHAPRMHMLMLPPLHRSSAACCVYSSRLMIYFHTKAPPHIYCSLSHTDSLCLPPPRRLISPVSLGYSHAVPRT